MLVSLPVSPGPYLNRVNYQPNDTIFCTLYLYRYCAIQTLCLVLSLAVPHPPFYIYALIFFTFFFFALACLV